MYRFILLRVLELLNICVIHSRLRRLRVLMVELPAVFARSSYNGGKAFQNTSEEQERDSHSQHGKSQIRAFENLRDRNESEKNCKDDQ